MSNVIESTWNERHKAHVDRIRKNFDWYRQHGNWNRLLHRATSGVVLLCSVIAPVEVVSSTSSLDVLGISQTTASQIAILVTVLLAFTEGLRRQYLFEQRWTTAYMSAKSLDRMLRAYQNGIVGKAIGSEEWQEAFHKSEEDLDTFLSSETSQFFEDMLSAAADKPLADTGS